MQRMCHQDISSVPSGRPDDMNFKNVRDTGYDVGMADVLPLTAANRAALTEPQSADCEIFVRAH